MLCVPFQLWFLQLGVIHACVVKLGARLVLLKLFSEKCVYVCMYVCLFFCIYVNKVL